MQVDWLKLNLVLWIVWGAYWLIRSKKVNATQSSESSFERLKHVAPIAIAFALLFIGGWNFLLLNEPLLQSREWEIIGVVVTAIGLAFAVWARVHLGKYWSGIITLKDGHRLIRTGPYRLVRHPIYTGFLLGLVGSAMTLGRARGLIAVLIVFAAYFFKVNKEEKVLISQFGEEYIQFKREVKAIVPFLL